ncbi:MAG: pyrroline-5-carboxylate reductase [Actinobacteria bacterium]|nr:pyrroline-5-carboxylate reductase [Actinomycetota bacterium]
MGEAVMTGIAFIGGGRMAGAMLSRLIGSGWCRGEEILVSDVDRVRLEQLRAEHGVKVTTDNREAASGSDTLVLAVKPQQLDGVLEEIRGTLHAGQLLVSIAMGKTTRYIEERIPEGVAVVRVMPNNPAMAGAAVSVISPGKHVREEDLERVEEIFGRMGDVYRVDESYQDAAMAISGCGPAYFYLVAEALADAGVKLGLDRELALKLVAGTMLGAAQMLRLFDYGPSRLKDMVASPGGSTIMALEALEEGGVRAAFFKAAEAAFRRAREV